MAAKSYDILIEQGATFSRRFRFKNPDLTLFDLTGYQFRGEIRSTATDNIVIAVFNFDLLNQTTNMGEVDWNINSDNTKTIPVKINPSYIKSKTKYVYDVERVAPDGTVVRIVEGIVTVSPEATR